jgi:hypothetical protein
MSPAAVVTYFLHDAEVQRLKIGRTTNLPKRLKDLQSTRGSPLRVLHVVTGDVEQEWHTRFQAARVRGEWFALTVEVVQTLRTTFGLRLRAPREQVRRHDPQRTRDWLDVLHEHIGLGLRYVDDQDGGLHELPEALDDWISAVGWEAHEHTEEEEESPDDCVCCAEDDEAVDRLCAALSATRNWMIGWCAPEPKRRDTETRWRDLWMVYWKPQTARGCQTLSDAVAEAECAIEDTDGGVYSIRFHAVLVDAATGEVNLDPYPAPELPPISDEERRAAMEKLAERYREIESLMSPKNDMTLSLEEDGE